MRVARRASKGSDPLLTTKAWRVDIRQHHIRLGLPCARCGGVIAYGAPRYYPGTRRVNPRSLVVGHIVGRDRAKRMGWTDAQINALSNTQSECARCSDSSGARYGNHKRGRAMRMLIIDDW
jgi:ribosomal protein S27AE